ncbi:MAG: DUF4202 domain-containing protein [Thermoleophilia bacterium]|nr:DUF4202 domain-containing protein [Thermoleophilia bacterium]
MRAAAAAGVLEARAEELVRTLRNGRHLLRTRDWILTLEPKARIGLRLAALLHDVDRATVGIPRAEQVASWDDRDALAEHAERAAALAARWLRAEGAAEPLARDVAALVRRHEVGGTDDADLLQAADSLSFLEVNPAASWVNDGLADRAEAERKLRWMYERVAIPAASEQGRALLQAALAQLVSTGSVLQDLRLAEPMRQHANDGRADGNTR